MHIIGQRGVKSFSSGVDSIVPEILISANIEAYQEKGKKNI